MPTTTSLCLVRHGETDWNASGLTQGSTDIPLNDTGRRQASETGTLLAEDSWDALVASPLARARETAEIIGRYTGLSDITLDPRLVERSFGLAEGMNADERKQAFPDKIIPGAEAWDAVRARALAAIETIRGEYAGKRVIVVSHGGAILNILAEVTGDALGPGKLVLENAGASLIEHDGEWRLRWWNLTLKKWSEPWGYVKQEAK